MATGKPVYQTQDMRLRTRSGEWIWFRNSFTHCGLRWHAMLRNLSEAKRVEVRAAALTVVRSMLPAHACVRSCCCAAQASLRDFLATTSHDARTPLSSIQARALTRVRTC
jgi:signal transduction histidine kinase